MEQGIRIRTLIFLSLIFSGITGMQAQSYYTFPDSNAVWKSCEHPYPPGPMIWYARHWDDVIMGDTLINNLLYKKIGRIDYDVECSQIFTGPYYYTAIREDTVERKVYQYDSNGEWLLYDFSLELGDTLNTAIAYDLVAVAVDSVLVGDSFRKRWTYQYDEASTPIDVIEGIGAMTGLLEIMISFEHIYYLRCYYEGDEVVYINGVDQCDLEIDTCISVRVDELKPIRTFTAYPNPFTTSATIEYELEEISDIQFTVYNMIGEVVYKIEDRMMPQGTHKITWSPGHLPVGLYYGVLRSGEGVSVVKMVKQ
ncbi:MAG: T9SS type A sorting domain-containing protein [Bacteroidota bacterium]